MLEEDILKFLNSPISSKKFVSSLKKTKITSFITSLTHRQIFKELSDEFPKGFRSRQANSYLRENYSLKINLAYLYTEGILVKEKQKILKDYVYFFNPYALKHLYAPDEEQTIANSAKALVNLFLEIEGIGGLEESILENKHFREFMSDLKETNPTLYIKYGGIIYETMSKKDKIPRKKE